MWLLDTSNFHFFLYFYVKIFFPQRNPPLGGFGWEEELGWESVFEEEQMTLVLGVSRSFLLFW
jgi:hypothetical protein